MTPHDLIDLAADLATGITEASWRAAVSRAYYAAFHTARALLTSCGFVVPRGDRGHAYLWLRLSNCGHPDLCNAGVDLKRLRRVRNWADYDLDLPFAHASAVAQVQTGLDLVDILEQAPTSPTTMVNITATMRAYERDVLGEVTWHP